ncbi:MAG: hypothetical protein CMQ15_08070 [Gammaproteobacteria bacterium]|nr:hypothetical protein [Gammaproteobacteria bacterium]
MARFNMLKRIFQYSLLIHMLAIGTVALAQDKIPWTDLSYEERQILQQVENQWDNLSVERQQRLRRGASRWERMQPQERAQAQAQAQDQQQRFQNLSPQQ